MNNLIFFEENGAVKTELQESSIVESTDPRLKVFNADDRPVYLTIHFNSPMDSVDLACIYDRLIMYKLIELTKAIDEVVAEDINENHGDMMGSNFEIKCHDFRAAFDCAVELTDRFKCPGLGGWNYCRLTITLSEEPSKEFLEIMENKKG